MSILVPNGTQKRNFLFIYLSISSLSKPNLSFLGIYDPEWSKHGKVSAGISIKHYYIYMRGQI